MAGRLADANLRISREGDRTRIFVDVIVGGELFQTLVWLSVPSSSLPDICEWTSGQINNKELVKRLGKSRGRT